MIRKLLKLAVVLIIGVLIYNFFLGTPDEKDNARAIFKEVKDVAVGVKDLVKSEREKFDSGKYDKAVDKVGSLLSKLRENAKNFDEKYIQRIEELSKKRRELREALSEYEADERNSDTSEEKSRKQKKESAKIQDDLNDLLKETESLIEEMEES